MRRLLLLFGAGLSLSACEFDTSPEHLAYCARGGMFGCGRGTAMLMPVLAGAAAGYAAGQAAQPQPVYVMPSGPMSCTSTRFGNTIQTNCH